MGTVGHHGKLKSSYYPQRRGATLPPRGRPRPRRVRARDEQEGSGCYRKGTGMCCVSVLLCAVASSTPSQRKHPYRNKESLVCCVFNSDS